MESHSLKCNTEKDKHIKLNYKTAGNMFYNCKELCCPTIQTQIYNAGILAGVWPCGTVTLIGELYGAESKSQVYGLTHGFLYNNQKSTKDLSTFNIIITA